MIELVTSKQVLSEVLFEGVSFKKALRNSFTDANQKSDLRNIVSMLVGCELRHNILFKKMLSKTGLEYTLDERAYLYLALANHYFLKQLAEDKVQSFLKENLGEKYEKITGLFNVEGPVITYLELPEKSVDFMSVRFNVPRWIIKMWIGQIGLSATFRALLSLSKPVDQTYRLNPYDDKAKELLDKNVDSLTNIVTKDVVRILKKSYHRNAELRGDHLFPIDEHLKEMVDKYQDVLAQEVTLVSSSDDSLALELIARSNNKVGINIAALDYDDRANLVRYARVHKCRNVCVSNAKDLIAMKAAISRPTDIVYCNPKSSAFGLINAYPDHLIHLIKPELDALVSKQKEALENASNFVCNHGTLIYVVNTLSINETNNLVKEFIDKHEEFSLVEEQQFVAKNNYASFLYYAVLRYEQKEKND